MKFLLALLVLTSFSAFADFEYSSNDMDSAEIRKALLAEITQGSFKCSGNWDRASIIAPILTSTNISNWKISDTVTDTNPSILAEAEDVGGKLAFTFKVTDDFKSVKSFTYEYWTVTYGEKNVGTLMQPLFEKSEIRANEYKMTCER